MAKSKEEIISMIENDLVDPSTNKITGERVKARLLDMVDAMGQGGGGQMEYWSFPNGLPDDYNTEMVAALATLAKYTAYGQTSITPPSLALMMNVKYTSFERMAFNKDLKIVCYGDDVVTVGFLLTEVGIDLVAMGGVQITEEEFYTI